MVQNPEKMTAGNGARTCAGCSCGIAFMAVGLLLAGCLSRSGPDAGGQAGVQPATMVADRQALPSPAPYLQPPSAQAKSEIFTPVPSAGKPGEGFNTEEYEFLEDNPFRESLMHPVSTFSIDVDTASYANIRRHLLSGRTLPPKDSVRIEEMVNYFEYSYPEPAEGRPVAATFALSDSPWKTGNLLLRIAVKAKPVEPAALPPANLVFLIDTSGSMYDDNKLPLLKDSLAIMVDRLRDADRVSIVTYAGNAGTVLDSVPGSRKQRILDAIGLLEAGGSTAGGAGIRLAYEVAKKNFISGGNNRVILCTDGDFNVGVSSTSELERLIGEKRRDAIFLTVLGLGTGNYKDSRMEALADKGNGNYSYIDTLVEANKVLGKELWGNLFAVAKDVKIQIEFNPSTVHSWRLLGYENRLLAREDFVDDSKDAGEMGAGQTVTAFYELVPATAAMNSGSPSSGSATPGGPGSSDGSERAQKPDTSAGSPSSTPVDPLVFQKTTVLPSEDLFVFRLRYKTPGKGDERSELVSTTANRNDLYRPFRDSDEDFRFAAAVAGFGMLLRNSPYKGSADWDSVMRIAQSARGSDPDGHRAEFVKLAEQARILEKKR